MMENRDNQFQKQEERQEERMENRTYQENNHNPQLDEEVAQEVAPNPALMQDRRENNKRKEEAGGFGIGLTALILSVLSFFVWPFVLSIAGIIVGIFAVRRRSALGWWAIAVGIVALIVALFLFPFRLLF
jgi:type VI protein secretion system component VasF